MLELLFETDLPPGSDGLGEIRRGTKAAERMEFELFNRFAVSSVTTWHYRSEMSISNQNCAPSCTHLVSNDRRLPR